MEGGGAVQQFNAPQAPKIAKPPVGAGGALGAAEKEVLDLQAKAAECMAAEKAAGEKLHNAYIDVLEETEEAAAAKMKEIRADPGSFNGKKFENAFRDAVVAARAVGAKLAAAEKHLEGLKSNSDASVAEEMEARFTSMFTKALEPLAAKVEELDVRMKKVRWIHRALCFLHAAHLNGTAGIVFMFSKVLS